MAPTMRAPLWMRIRAKVSPKRRALKRLAQEITDSWEKALKADK